MSVSPTYKLIAFDFDGTLVDSAPDVAAAVNGMLLELGRQPISMESVRNYMGNGVEVLTKRALTGDLWAEPPDDVFREALTTVLKHYRINNGRHTVLYETVMESLQALYSAGIVMTCITNKKREFTEPLLVDLQLRNYFELLVCGDDLPQRKPDPMPLLHIMQRLGLDASQTLMVGDSVTDIKTARAAGVKVVAVSYGYNHGEDIRLADPDWVIDSLAEIRTILGLAE